MTRKDYEAIASAILAVRADIEARNLDAVRIETEWNVTKELAETLSGLFVEDNPRFQPARFLAACGL